VNKRSQYSRQAQRVRAVEGGVRGFVRSPGRARHICSVTHIAVPTAKKGRLDLLQEFSTMPACTQVSHA
jgi:hypothetical protein